MRAIAQTVRPRGGLQRRSYEVATMRSSSANINKFTLRRWWRNRVSRFHQAFDVKLNCSLNECHNFLAIVSCGYTARQVRHVGAKPRITLLHYD